MATEQSFTNLFSKIPSGFPIDKDATSDAFRNWASFNERFAGIALDTASRSNEIVTNSAQETFTNLRDFTKAHDEPREYSQAFANFVQAQVALTQQNAQAFSKLLEQAKDDTSELFSQAGEKAYETARANVETAVEKTSEKVKSATEETAEKVEAATDETAEKVEDAANETADKSEAEADKSAGRAKKSTKSDS